MRGERPEGDTACDRYPPPQWRFFFIPIFTYDACFDDIDIREHESCQFFSVSAPPPLRDPYRRMLLSIAKRAVRVRALALPCVSQGTFSHKSMIEPSKYPETSVDSRNRGPSTFPAPLEPSPPSFFPSPRIGTQFALRVRPRARSTTPSAP
jgi:hypothetical protein